MHIIQSSIPGSPSSKSIHFSHTYQAIAVSWAYGVDRALEDLATMGMAHGPLVRWYWKSVWTVFMPIGGLVRIQVTYYVVMGLKICVVSRKEVSRGLSQHILENICKFLKTTPHTK